MSCMNTTTSIPPSVRWHFLKLRWRMLNIIVLSALVLAPALARWATAGSFTLVGSMRQFRRQHTATLLLNGKVLVAGGAPFLPAATSEIYDPIATTWTNSGALNTGRELHTATQSPNGTVMVTGRQTA